jgi:hypothetical protein
MSDIDTSKWANKVQTAAMAIRVAQRVFTLGQIADSIPVDTFHHDRLSLSKGRPKPYVEIKVAFSLADDVNDRDWLATSHVAPILAHVEDSLLFQGEKAKFPDWVTVNERESLGHGMIGLAEERTIRVQYNRERRDFGDKILAAIEEGKELLTQDLLVGELALIMGTKAYAATMSSSVFNCVRTCTAVNSSLTMSGCDTAGPNAIWGTAAMPPNVALLVKPDWTIVYADDAPQIQSLGRSTHAGNQLFLLSERFQYVAKDRRAFVKIVIEIEGGEPKAKPEKESR